MKKLLIISLALISLTLGQWSSLEHAFHEHAPGEQCDYCLSAKSLDHGLVSTPLIHSGSYAVAVETTSRLLPAGHRSHRHYSVRAPPHSI